MTDIELKSTVNKIYLDLNAGLGSVRAAEQYGPCDVSQREFHMGNAITQLEAAFNRALALQNTLFYGTPFNETAELESAT